MPFRPTAKRAPMPRKCARDPRRNARINSYDGMPFRPTAKTVSRLRIMRGRLASRHRTQRSNDDRPKRVQARGDYQPAAQVLVLRDFLGVPEIGVGEKGETPDNDQIIDFLQPRTEPRHDHGCRFITESQEVDRNTGTDRQRQAPRDPCGRCVPITRRENVLLVRGGGCALRGSTPGTNQPLLARPRWRKLDINSILQQRLLDREANDGLFVFIVDATLTTQGGKNTENTISTGNRQRRPCKGAGIASTSMLGRIATASPGAC